MRHLSPPAPCVSLALLAALWLALPPAAAASRGDLSLEVGTGALVRDAGRQPAFSAQMGFRFGATDHSEVRLAVDYGRFYPSTRGESQMVLTGFALGTYFTPYPGPVQPMLGGHVGMVEIDHAWRMDLGLQAQVLARVHPRLAACLSVDPGMWMADGGPELWVRTGVGLRMSLPH